MKVRDYLKANIGNFAVTLIAGCLFLLLAFVLALIHNFTQTGPHFMKFVLVLAYLPGELHPYSKLGAMAFFWLQGFLFGGVIDSLRYLFRRRCTKHV